MRFENLKNLVMLSLVYIAILLILFTIYYLFTEKKQIDTCIKSSKLTQKISLEEYEN